MSDEEKVSACLREKSLRRKGGEKTTWKDGGKPNTTQGRKEEKERGWWREEAVKMRIQRKGDRMEASEANG